ncbi:MAG TPA: GTP 3',8-cyclase MoaA [Clostridiales bacterium]|jgi:cyclic pyranopterin phosphate synthase|nr:GTP 3',8-cyclase MoaA [Clostridiales bacterium]
MIDQYGRRINYARISITDLCNLRCQYCMPEEGVTKKDCGEILRLEDFFIIARNLIALGIDKIRLTGGEPLVRRGIIKLVEWIGQLPGLRDFAMTTNGLLLPLYAEGLKAAGLQRLNISLDTTDSDKYRRITRGGDVRQALAGLEKAMAVGFRRIKINVVLIKGFNDDEVENFVEMTKKRPLDVRFIELMPFAGQHEFAADKYMPGEDIIKRYPEMVAETADDPSAPARYYRLPGAPGRVGLIEPMSHRFCDACNRIRITADGQLLSCLHSRAETDLKPYLNDEAGMQEQILYSIKHKPITHRLAEGSLMERDMGKIGG